MGTGDQPFAWQSDDGLTWRDAVSGHPGRGATLIHHGAHRRTAVLKAGRGERTDVRASVDGKVWSAVEAPPGATRVQRWVHPGRCLPRSCLGRRLGVLAIYESDAAPPLRSAWQRGDADLSWSQGSLGSKGFFVSVRRDLGRHRGWRQGILFGSRGGVATLMTSTDLATWSPLRIPEAGAVLGLRIIGGADGQLVTSPTPDPAART